jgi:hypothetical protein
LWNIGQVLNRLSLFHPAGKFSNRLFAHSVEQDISARIDQDGRVQLIRPVVIMGNPAERSFNATNNKRDIGEKLTEDIRIGNGGIIGPVTGPASRRVGIVGTFAVTGGLVGSPSNPYSRL